MNRDKRQQIFERLREANPHLRELLERELKELSVLGSNLERLGFTAAELNVALGQRSINGLTDEDDVPAVRGR